VSLLSVPFFPIERTYTMNSRLVALLAIAGERIYE
jgi:hypothetical protein